MRDAVVCIEHMTDRLGEESPRKKGDHLRLRGNGTRLFLPEDFHLLGKITHFDHEWTHKRVVQTLVPLKAK